MVNSHCCENGSKARGGVTRLLLLGFAVPNLIKLSKSIRIPFRAGAAHRSIIGHSVNSHIPGSALTFFSLLALALAPIFELSRVCYFLPLGLCHTYNRPLSVSFSVPPLPFLPSRPPTPTPMCNYRRVREIFHVCGHEFEHEETIDCHRPTCKFSTFHRQEPHDCRRTCLQYRQFPQQYAVHIERMCPSCT